MLTLTVNPLGDAYLRSGQPTINYGTIGTADFGRTAGGAAGNKRPIFKYPRPSALIVPGTTIHTVTHRLNVTTQAVTADAGNLWGLGRTLAVVEDEATWNKANADDDWLAAGGDIDDAADNVGDPLTLPTVTGWWETSAKFSSLYQIALGHEELWFILTKVVDGAGANCVFKTRESGEATSPQLVFGYTPPPSGPKTTVIVGAAIAKGIVGPQARGRR